MSLLTGIADELASVVHELAEFINRTMEAEYGFKSEENIDDLVGWVREENRKHGATLPPPSDVTIQSAGAIPLEPTFVQQKPGNLTVTLAGNVEVLRFEPNGDIYVRGKLTENDKAVVQGMREFVEAVRGKL